MFYSYVDGGAAARRLRRGGEAARHDQRQAAYEIDGKTYGVPYRQDSWVLYYNKDLFDKAKVAYPDGSWTWDDYAKAAKDLTTGLKAAGSQARRRRTSTRGSRPCRASRSRRPPAPTWRAATSSTSSRTTTGSLDLQNAGAQPNFGTVTTAKLTYQGQFGKQSAAMMPMGTWYVATLLAQQKSGDADTFKWGIAPAPQFDSSTTGTSKTPVTFGDPTGLGINAAITDGTKLAVAKEFLAYAAGAGRRPRRSPASASRRRTRPTRSCRRYFSLPGVPTDDLSKFAWSTHDTKPENPVSKYTAGLQNVLNDTALGDAVRQQDRSTTRSPRPQDQAKSDGPQPVATVG